MRQGELGEEGTFPHDESTKRRANTLEVSRRHTPIRATSFYAQHDEVNVPPTAPIEQSYQQQRHHPAYQPSQEYLGAQEVRLQHQAPPRHISKSNNRSFTNTNNVYENSTIREEAAEQSSSHPSLSRATYTAREPTSELVNSLEFSFFKKVYHAYNTIWQQVLKLPIYGENYVSRSEFVRILRNCKVIDSDNSNVFCNFLLFSCANHLKSQHPRRDDQVLLDFRFFLKSIFMTLKRQFEEAQSGENEKIFHAEMFLVDHFWQFAVQTAYVRSQSDLARGKEAIADARDNTDRTADSLAMEIFQQKIFEFFDRQQAPYLLQIAEIEIIVTECFKTLIERKKRKDVISKRTFRKVISRQCHGVLCRALQGFLPPTIVSQPSQELVKSQLAPFSLPMSSPVTDSERLGSTFTGLGSKQRPSVDQQQQQQTAPTRHRLQARSVPKSSATTSETQILNQTGNRDQKSTNVEKPPKMYRDELGRGIDTKAHGKSQMQKVKIHPRSSQSQPAARRPQTGPSTTLCKQLQTKIVIRKLQSALDSFRKRQAFAAVLEADLTFRHEDEEESSTNSDRFQVENVDTMQSGTKQSSDGLELTIEKSPVRSDRQRKHYIPVSQLNSHRKERIHQIQTKPQPQRPQEVVATQSRRLVPELDEQNQSRRQRSRKVGSEVLPPTRSKERHHQRPNVNNSYAGIENDSLPGATTHLYTNQMSSQGNCSCSLVSCNICNNPRSLTNHLFSYHQDDNYAREYAAAHNNQRQNSTDNSNYRTSSFNNQNTHQSQERQSRSRHASRHSRKQSSDVSDQKIPRDTAVYSSDQMEDTNPTNRTQEKNDTQEILTKILAHETQNQECLQELVKRISNLEQSNKVGGRKKNFENVQHLVDAMNQGHQSAGGDVISPTASQCAAMTFQPESSSGRQCSTDRYPPQECFEDNNNRQEFPGTIDSVGEIQRRRMTTDMSQSQSDLEFTHQYQEEKLYMMATEQLNKARNYQQNVPNQQRVPLGQQGQVLMPFARHLQGYPLSQSQSSLGNTVSQTQSVDLGNHAEQFCHQHFYEMSKEEDRNRQIESQSQPYTDQVEEDEMDFEANKEQRPLQIMESKKSMPDFTISSASHFSSQQQLLAGRTHDNNEAGSDRYINTSNNVKSTVSQSYPYDLPYVITTDGGNSFSKNSKSVGQNMPAQHQQQFSQQWLEGQHSLAFTLSDKTAPIGGSTDQQLPSQVTSAPNLKKIASNMLNRQTEIQLKELVPYSNRVEGVAGQIDPRSYVSTNNDPLAMSQASVPTEDLDRTNVNSREVSYAKKYKKAKKQLKLLLREKREYEQRTHQIMNDNSVLQDHLEKTALSAQEVSNQNSLIHNELSVHKLFTAIRNLVRFKATLKTRRKMDTLRKCFTKWQAESEKIDFLSEQTRYQEHFLSEMQRQETAFKQQIQSLQIQIGKMHLKQRTTVLGVLMRDRAKQEKTKAFLKWKSFAQSDTARIDAYNMQEDLSHVVTQLNHFRVQLVFSKIQAALNRPLTGQLSSAFDSLRKNQTTPPTAVHQHSRSLGLSHLKPPQYKSPFMKYLTRNQANSFVAPIYGTSSLSINTENINNLPRQKETSTNETANNNRLDVMRTVGGGPDMYRRGLSLSSIGHRSNSTSMMVPTTADKNRLAFQTDFADNNMTPKQAHHDDVLESDERPMAPRISEKANGRSRSDMRSSKKEDFRLRMDDKLHKMRAQGQMVEGLVKLHELYTKVNTMAQHYTLSSTFKVLLSFGMNQRRRQSVPDDSRRGNGIPYTTKSAQSFPVTSSCNQRGARSASNPPTGGGQYSQPGISLESSVGSLSQFGGFTQMRGDNSHINSFKVSTGSLNFGSSNQGGGTANYNMREMQAEQPRDKPPKMHKELNQARHNRAMMRHLRTSSEMQLEQPRIMAMSPSMNNISGPELTRSATTAQFQRASDAILLKNRKIPKPKKWIP